MAWKKYELGLKRYIDWESEFKDNIQKAYNIIISQCSLFIERALGSEPSFNKIKQTSDSAGLIKMLDSMCYNYQSYEYPPLGTYEAFDLLQKNIQPNEVDEAKYYKSVKKPVEVCKASRVNSSVLCSYNVDMTMKQVHDSGDILRND